MKKFFIIVLLLVYITPLTSLSQNVSGLRAVFKNGQTFLTWNNLNIKNAIYYVYRSKQPFLVVNDIDKDFFIAKVTDSSAYNYRLSNILNKPVYYRIDDIGVSLNLNKCLYVSTAIEDAYVYYAVMVYINNKIIITINPDENTTKKPVFEKVEPVFPVFQTSIDTLGKTQDVYTHWVSKFDNKYYPSMTSAYNFSYNFAISRKNNGYIHPLIIYLHAKNRNFFDKVISSDNPEEWILYLDDYLPNEIQNTFWYGYVKGMNINNPDSIPKSGVVIDYTIRRVKWTLNWLVNNFPIDTNRVYLCGGSMGGSGAIQLGLSMPDKIAAVFAVVPKIDYSYMDDPNISNIYNKDKSRRKIIEKLWGDLNSNLLSSDNVPVYDRLNAGFMVKYKKSEDLPPIIAFNGKNDDVVGWAEKTIFYKRYDESKQLGIFFWDYRNHDLKSKQEWITEESLNKLYKFSKNKSFPAFTRCSINNFPGNGEADNGDKTGCINGHLTWSDSIVDMEDYYEINIFPKELKTLDGIIKPSDSIYVDVTLRRLQNFVIDSLHTYYFQNISKSGHVITDGYLDADKKFKLLTIKDFMVNIKGNKLKISSFKKSDFEN